MIGQQRRFLRQNNLSPPRHGVVFSGNEIDSIVLREANNVRGEVEPIDETLGELHDDGPMPRESARDVVPPAVQGRAEVRMRIYFDPLQDGSQALCAQVRVDRFPIFPIADEHAGFAHTGLPFVK